MENEFLVIVLLWPLVTVIAALLNMLISWTFSWSELVLDYFAGIMIGLFFVLGTRTDASVISKFFLVFSHGLFGLLSVLGTFDERTTLFLVSSIYMIIGVVVAGALDRLTISISTKMNVGGGLVSILIFLIKAPFALFTTTVSLIIFFLLSGIWVAFARTKTRIGFLGGALYIEWNSGGASSFATTLGTTINCWVGDLSILIRHELYHTRHYMVLRDWFIPFWILGGVWGWLSAPVSKTPFDIRYFQAAHHSKEVGNPLERAAYRKDGTSPF